MFSISNLRKGIGLNYEKRTFFITAGIYFNHRGLLNRLGKHLAFSLYNRKVWMSVLCHFLLNISGSIGPADCGNGICSRPGKSTQYGAVI